MWDWCGFTDPFRGGLCPTGTGTKGKQPVADEDVDGFRHWGQGVI